MSRGRVTTHTPRGDRACGQKGGFEWELATDDDGSKPFAADLQALLSKIPSAHARATFRQEVMWWMHLAEEGRIPQDEDHWAWMSVAPDVFEIKLPDWRFADGLMHVRIYYSEPKDLVSNLVALRLLAKRPGPIGVEDQDQHARDSSDLLLRFANRGFR